MATYLSVNGSADYLTTPSVTVNRVIMDINIDSTQVSSTYYYFLDWRTANSYWSYGHISTVPNAGWGGTASTLTNVIVNGTTTTGASTYDVPRGIDVTYEMNLNTTLAGAIQFFRKNDNTFYMKGKVYRLRGYNGAALVFDYNMSTGTVQDQSGNGNHATLTGGTWLSTGTPYTQSLSDSVSLSDSLSKTYTPGAGAYTKSLSDSITVSDAAPTKLVNRFKTVTDSVSVSEATTKAVIKTKTDTVTSADSVTPVYTPGGTSPIVQKVVGTGTSSTASANLTGTAVGNTIVAFVTAGSGTGTGNFAVTDTNANAYTQRSLLKSSSNTLSLAIYTAPITTGGNLTVNSSWSFGTPDTILTVLEVKGLVVYDGSATSESNHTTTPSVTTTTDGLVLGYFVSKDAANAHTYSTGAGYTLSDVTTFATNYTTLVEYQQSASAGSKTASVSFTGVTSFLKSINAIIAFQNGGTTFTKNFAETITTGDSVTNKAVSLAKSDTLAMGESVTKAKSRTLTETVTLSETDQVTKAKIRSDVLTLSDAIASIVGHSTFKSVADTVTVTDTIVLIKGKNVNVFDTVTFSDALSKKKFATLTDSMTASDTISLTKGRNISVSDAIAFSESLSKAKSATRADSITSNDTIVLSKGRNVSVSDTFTFSDSLSKAKTRTLTDSISSSDTITKQIQRLKNDVLSFLDGRTKSVSVRVGDYLVTTDTIQLALKPVVGVIHLSGELNLYVYLVGEQTDVSLLGEINSRIELWCELEGGANMTAVQQNFSLYAGETKFLPVTVYGNNVNIIGSTITWILKQENGPVMVTKTTANGITIDDSSHFTITLQPGDTKPLSGLFETECKMVDTNGNVTILFIGEVDILKSTI